MIEVELDPCDQWSLSNAPSQAYWHVTSHWADIFYKLKFIVTFTVNSAEVCIQFHLTHFPSWEYSVPMNFADKWCPASEHFYVKSYEKWLPSSNAKNCQFTCDILASPTQQRTLFSRDCFYKTPKNVYLLRAIEGPRKVKFPMHTWFSHIGTIINNSVTNSLLRTTTHYRPSKTATPYHSQSEVTRHRRFRYKCPRSWQTRLCKLLSEQSLTMVISQTYAIVKNLRT